MSLKRVEAAVGVLKLPITARAAGGRISTIAIPTITPPKAFDTCSMTYLLQMQVVKSILPSGSLGDKGRKIVTARISNCVTKRYHQYPFVYNQKIKNSTLMAHSACRQIGIEKRRHAISIGIADEIETQWIPKMSVEDEDIYGKKSECPGNILFSNRTLDRIGNSFEVH